MPKNTVHGGASIYDPDAVLPSENADHSAATDEGENVTVYEPQHEETQAGEPAPFEVTPGVEQVDESGSADVDEQADESADAESESAPE